MDAKDRIFVALDTTDLDRAVTLARALSGRVGGVKLGKEFFTARGPQGVAAVTAERLPLFLDLKFHDIPNTVAGAVAAAMALKPRFLNIHAAGGAAMIQAAAAALKDAGADAPKLLAVTVLTSLSDDDLTAVGQSGPVLEQVLRLAHLAQANGADGVVCSAREAAALRRACGPGFTLMVPGIRPASAAADDQKRVVTPAEAVALGADYLVIGRPITGAGDPAEAASRIAAEITGG